jgi:hypothetical protein
MIHNYFQKLKKKHIKSVLTAFLRIQESPDNYEFWSSI